jgi:ComF family protein
VILSIILNSALDVFFPPRCICCRKEDDLICEKCRKSLKIRFIEHSPPEDKNFTITSALHYSDCKVQKIITRFKFYHCKQIITELDEIFLLLNNENIIPKNAILCPVPLHFWRKNKRGFNQAELIARQIEQQTENRTLNLMKRVRHTNPQSSLGATDRRTNLQNAFQMRSNAKNIDKKTPIVLIDDVATTFSTLIECRKALQAAGFQNVSAFTIAVSPLR